jgi:hypothetical protein
LKPIQPYKRKGNNSKPQESEEGYPVKFRGNLTPLVTIIVAALVIGGLWLYLRPSNPSYTTYTPTSAQTTTRLASVENCTFAITTPFSRPLYGGAGGFRETGTTRINASYVITASTEMSTGALITSVISTPMRVSTFTTTTSTNDSTTEVTQWLGMPYTASCTYVK